MQYNRHISILPEIHSNTSIETKHEITFILLTGRSVDLLHPLAPGPDQEVLHVPDPGDDLGSGLAPGHVGLGGVREVDPLGRGLKEHALPLKIKNKKNENC